MEEPYNGGGDMGAIRQASTIISKAIPWGQGVGASME